MTVLGFILTALVVLFSSAIQAATGFGFSILAVPLLLLLHPPMVAVELNLIISVLLSWLLARQLRADLDPTLFVRLLPMSILGAPFGLAILMYVDVTWFKVGAGIIMGVFFLLLLARLRFARTPWRDRSAGFLAGIFTSAIGAGGVPLLLYFAGSDMDKARARATAVTFFLAIYAVALVLQTVVSWEPASQWPVWLLAVGLVPVALFGVRLGHRLYAHLSQKTFMHIIRALLIINSFVLLLDAWLQY